ncbi:CNH domain-containing protein [Phycomyces nitens]|nr:CNH domain-containing protein [Phycomyces nitens]
MANHSSYSGLPHGYSFSEPQQQPPLPNPSSYLGEQQYEYNLADPSQQQMPPATSSIPSHHYYAGQQHGYPPVDNHGPRFPAPGQGYPPHGHQHHESVQQPSNQFRMPTPSPYRMSSPPGHLSQVYPPVNYQVYENQQSDIYPPQQNYNQSVPLYPAPGYSRPMTNDYNPYNHHRGETNNSYPNNMSDQPPNHRASYISHRPVIPSTIERPKYNTEDQNNDLGFIPVSPDSSDDEEYVSQPSQPRADPTRYTASHSQELANAITEQLAKQNLETISAPYPGARQSSLGVSENGPRPLSSEPELPPAPQKPDYSFVSVFVQEFLSRIHNLETVRELFCVSEYPESFKGQEAVAAIHSILGGRFSEKYCISIAIGLMRANPPLFKPIHYSHKSLMTNSVYNSPDEIYTFDEDSGSNELPTGIYTNLTKCYVRDCLPDQGGCYAPKCPNRPDLLDENTALPSDLSRQSSLRRGDDDESNGQDDDNATSYPHSAWAARVPKELLDSLSSREKARQEAINELIYSEEQYRDDLNILHEVYVTPILNSNIIDKDKRESFVNNVFSNYDELKIVSSSLFQDLRKRQQKYDQKCVPMIGDVMTGHIGFFGSPFLAYLPNVAMAEYLISVERSTNSEFDRFLDEASKGAQMRRLPLRHFLMNPVTRLQRYPLLIDAIIKKTDKDHDDYKFLEHCREVIAKFAKTADELTEGTKQKLEIRRINDRLIPKQGEQMDLGLLDSQRKLFYSGDLKRRNNGIEVTEKSDIHVFIFDHVMLLTKQRKTSVGEEYRIWKRPIPLLALFVQGSSDMTGSGFGGIASTNSGSTTALMINHIGHGGGIYNFFCSRMEDKINIINSIEKAKTELKKKQEKYNMFELTTLDDSSFRYMTTSNSPSGQGKINCSIPFVSIDGEQKVAIGTETGVSFKSLSTNIIRTVLLCGNVVGLDLLEKHHILLVLTEKNLKAYPIDALDSPSNTKPPEKLGCEITQGAGFVQTGHCNGRDLMLFMKRKTNQSWFTVMEPVADLRDPKNAKLLPQKTGMFSTKTSQLWFKKYKDFYVGADASHVHFLKHKLNVVCVRGFEIIDPENLNMERSIPDSDDPQFNFIQRHTEPLVPLAMYRVQTKFLLCYNKFAFYVNNRGGSLANRVAGRTPLLCEWEGNPDRIVYHHPYIIAFDKQFIEVRHFESGELVQIIPGDNIRLTYYNNSGEAAIIHGCMNNPQKQDSQLLFKLSLEPSSHDKRRLTLGSKNL